ncbi:MAG TPA: protein kinase [Kofleriaceae bacterium]
MTNGSGAQLMVGEQVGSYRIISHLVGYTYRAVHVSNARRALIDIAPSDNWREMSLQMMRAQRLVESLQHPGIARIVERGMLDDRRPWIATDVPSGIGIYEVIARRELPSNELTALIRDIADVLAYAHALGVVHRALTLRSIVLATGARSFPIAIADWGMRSGEIGVYAAPELSTGAGYDGRADVYSLGVIAFRAATRMFPGDGGVFEVPGVPSGLATLITRMLAIAPHDRPTAAEVRAHAAELLANERAIEAAAAATPVPELLRFAEETPPTADDIVYPGGPRFGKPKWTPSPDVAITSERAPTANGEISKKPR